MRGSILLAAARAAVLTLAIGSTFSPTLARGATKHHAPTGPSAASFAYDTTGSLDVQAAPSTVSGPAVLQFQGVTNGTYTSALGQPIQLGQFVVAPSTTPLSGPTTFNGTPFDVEITAPEFDKTTKVSLLDQAFHKLGNTFHLKTETLNSLLIRGTLSGTVSATGQSNVAATIGSIRLGGLEAHTMDHVTRYTFPIRFGALKLPPSWTMSTTAPTSPSPVTVPAAEMLAPPPAAVSIQATPTPEPSTFAVFAVAFGAVALARRRGAR